MAEIASSLVSVQELKKYFPVPTGFFNRNPLQLKAVNGVNLHIQKGETLGLVGESGSGKSTVGNLILRLLKATSGQIRFNGLDVTDLPERRLKTFRRRAQMVFQDPQSSLDPRMIIKNIVGYPLKVHRMAKGRALEDRVAEMLKEVGLSPEHLFRYPHEFSGGQRQRIGIARALITEPDFIVFDEPTSALDVSVQAQMLNLIRVLQERGRYAYLFISHDLAVVRLLSHRIAVMYLGEIVETASRNRLFHSPLHPYTRALMASVPRPDPTLRQDLAALTGDVPSPVHLPAGCTFHPRCPEKMEICTAEPPQEIEAEPGHRVKCHLYG